MANLFCTWDEHEFGDQRMYCNGLNDAPDHLDSVNVASFGKKIFAYVLKDLELRSSWITWVDLKSNDKCAYNKQKRRRE